MCVILFAFATCCHAFTFNTAIEQPIFSRTLYLSCPALMSLGAGLSQPFINLTYLIWFRQCPIRSNRHCKQLLRLSANVASRLLQLWFPDGNTQLIVTRTWDSLLVCFFLKRCSPYYLLRAFKACFRIYVWSCADMHVHEDIFGCAGR